MSRLMLVFLLVIGCGKSDHGTPEVEPARAGKILELAGKVTVGARTLAVGDNLAADDVVETAADSRVVVELTHNLARWELGPNKRQKVSDSIAWKLPRNEGNAQVVIQDMSAAGRPAERAAADTPSSAAAPPPTNAPATPPPAPAAPTTPAPRSPPKPVAISGGKAAQAPEIADKRMAFADDEAPAPLLKSSKGGAPATDRIVSAGDHGAAPKAKAHGPHPDVIGVDRDPDMAAMRHDQRAYLLRPDETKAIAVCLTADVPHVALKIRVDDNGAKAVEIDGKGAVVTSAVKACIQKVVNKLDVQIIDARLSGEVSKP